MSFFITLTGPRGVGKDYVAVKLRDSLRKLSVNARRMSLAHPIKEVVSDLTGLSLEDIELAKRSPATGIRQLLIDVGMAGRKYDENFWINKGKAQTKALDVAIIPDVRFEHEIKEFGDMNLCGYNNTMPPPPSTMIDDSERLAWTAHCCAVESVHLHSIQWVFVLNNRGPASEAELELQVDIIAGEVRDILMWS